jgi:regulator of RNase E activity RraA
MEIACLTARYAGGATVLTRFAALNSAAVSDALEACGLPPGQGSLRQMWGRPKVTGLAATAELEPLSGGHGGSHILTEVVAQAGAGNVLVIANGGRMDVSSWGGILSVGASVRSIRGVITDGACRDVPQARELGFPVFARGQVPVTARGRLRQRSAGEPIQLGPVTVKPGDVVLADEGGVVVVPRARAMEVLAAAEAICAREARIEAEIRAGASVPATMRDPRLAGTEAE